MRSVKLRPATEADQHIPAFDFSALSAINTCPVWGITRHGLKKQMPGAGRSMALEAGSAAHDAFAAIRLYQLARPQKLSEHANHHGLRLFGEARWNSIRRSISNGVGEDRADCINAALEALYSSGFHDDPGDRRRTVTNIEEALIAYVDRWDHDRYPVWVRSSDDPTMDVGVEIGFDFVIEFEYDLLVEGHDFFEGIRCQYRFIGKMDGLHWDGNTQNLVVHENKTASRLNDAWMMSFQMSHQVTGYCVAATSFSGINVDRAVVLGLQIPLPKSGDLGGIVRNPVRRYPHQVEAWARWFLTTVHLYEEYVGEDRIKIAPQYTHSCNRYFRPCSMISFCAGTDEDKDQILGEMEPYEWSPLDSKVAD